MSRIAELVAHMEIVPGPPRNKGVHPNAWKPEEEEILRKHYASKGPRGCAELLPGRTVRAVQAWAQRVGVAVPKGWTAEEDAILLAKFPTIGAKGCKALLPGRTIHAIQNRAVRFKITCKQPPWSEFEDEVLRKFYPGGGSAAVAERIKRTQSAIGSRAEILGVRCENPKVFAGRRRIGEGPRGKALRVVNKPVVLAKAKPKEAKKPVFAGPADYSRAKIIKAPPMPDRWAVKSAPRVVDSSDCREWAKVAA